MEKWNCKLSLNFDWVCFCLLRNNIIGKGMNPSLPTFCTCTKRSCKVEKHLSVWKNRISKLSLNFGLDWFISLVNNVIRKGMNPLIPEFYICTKWSCKVTKQLSVWKNGIGKLSLNFGWDCFISLINNDIGKGMNPPIPAFYTCTKWKYKVANQ